MREVAVIGIGQIKIDEHWDQSLREMAGNAVLAAVNDANMEHVDALYVGNMMSGSANNQHQLGAYIADWVGLRYSESIKLEICLQFWCLRISIGIVGGFIRGC